MLKPLLVDSTFTKQAVDPYSILLLLLSFCAATYFFGFHFKLEEFAVGQNQVDCAKSRPNARCDACKIRGNVGKTCKAGGDVGYCTQNPDGFVYCVVTMIRTRSGRNVQSPLRVVDYCSEFGQNQFVCKNARWNHFLGEKPRGITEDQLIGCIWTSKNRCTMNGEIQCAEGEYIDSDCVACRGNSGKTCSATGTDYHFIWGTSIIGICGEGRKPQCNYPYSTSGFRPFPPIDEKPAWTISCGNKNPQQVYGEMIKAQEYCRAGDKSTAGEVINALSAECATYVRCRKPALWSGDIALSLLARNEGRTTLEVTQLGVILDKKVPFLQYSRRDCIGAIWNGVSRQFTEQMSGRSVHVYMNAFREASTFLMQELPELAKWNKVQIVKFIAVDAACRCPLPVNEETCETQYIHSGNCGIIVNFRCPFLGETSFEKQLSIRECFQHAVCGNPSAYKEANLYVDFKEGNDFIKTHEYDSYTQRYVDKADKEEVWEEFCSMDYREYFTTQFTAMQDAS